MRRRLVLLLSTELTPRQKAVRKYKQSPKGRANARAYNRRRYAKDPARVLAMNKASKLRNADKIRVYKRVYQRMWRLRNLEARRAYDRAYYHAHKKQKRIAAPMKLAA